VMNLWLRSRSGSLLGLFFVLFTLLTLYPSTEPRGPARSVGRRLKIRALNQNSHSYLDPQYSSPWSPNTQIASRPFSNPS
jgi:hypothetical protein